MIHLTKEFKKTLHFKIPVRFHYFQWIQKYQFRGLFGAENQTKYMVAVWFRKTVLDAHLYSLLVNKMCVNDYENRSLRTFGNIEREFRRANCGTKA